MWQEWNDQLESERFVDTILVGSDGCVKIHRYIVILYFFLHFLYTLWRASVLAIALLCICRPIMIFEECLQPRELPQQAGVLTIYPLIPLDYRQS
jgi:hypothetical protein